MPSILTQEFKQIDLKDIDAATMMGDFLLLKMYPQEEMSSGSSGEPMVLPDSAREKRAAGWIIAVGKGGCHEALAEPSITRPFLVGDTVLCPMESLNKMPEMSKDHDIRYIYANDVILHWKAERCPKKS